jgi:hypothetical protein
MEVCCNRCGEKFSEVLSHCPACGEQAVLPRTPKNDSYCNKCGGHVRVIEFQTYMPITYRDCMCKE